MLKQPVKSARNLADCVVSRILKDPTGGLLKTPEREESFYTWVKLKTTSASMQFLDMMEAIQFSNLDLPSVEECAAMMSGLKGKLLNATHALLNMTTIKPRKTVNVKWNEHIKDGTPESPDLKSRAVSAMSNDCQEVDQPIIRMLTHDAKETFDGSTVTEIKTVSGNTERVRFVISNGDLKAANGYGTLMEESSEAVVVVSCDDTVGTRGDSKHPTFSAMKQYFEADYSAYDQSQLFWMWSTLLTWLSSILPPDLFEIIKASILTQTSMPFKAKVRGFSIKGQSHVQMPTGASFTSIFGSLHNFMLWVLAIHLELPITEACKLVGVTIKLQESDDLKDVTFLRGFWALNKSNERVWTNMPSLSLKIGKILVDPSILAKKSLERPDPVLAAHTVWWAMMQSVKVPYDYPILGAMRAKSETLPRAELSDATAAHIIDNPYISENARYKMMSDSEVTRQSVLDFMLTRYNITETEVVLAEMRIMVVPRLPCMLFDPLYLKMKERDYT
jgi:hypothetical protein